MVHHEWRQQGCRNVSKAETVPGGLCAPPFHPRVLVKQRRRRSRKHRPPPAAGRLARLGGADAEEAGEGRHPTSAMRGKKRKDEKGGGEASACGRGFELRHQRYESQLAFLKTPEEITSGCSGSPTSYPLRLTDTHSAACPICHCSPHPVSCRPSRFMISRLFGNAFQKVPSLLYQWPRIMKPQVVFVLGGPGAGKGTQCSKIVEVGRML